MKGQNLRIGIKEGSGTLKYIAAALSFDLSVDVDTEESTTKDSTNGWKEYETNMKGWSGSGQAEFVQTDAAAYAGLDIFDLIGQTVQTDFDITSGEKNRVLSTGLLTGSAIITSWKINSSNASKVTVDFAFQGTGALSKKGA